MNRLTRIDLKYISQEFDELGFHATTLCDEETNSRMINNIHKSFNELREYKSIEDDLGIDLNVLFWALKNGFFVKKGTINEGLISSVEAKDIRSIDLVTHNIYFNVCDLVFFENYGRTWALSKEELEVNNEKTRTD